MKLSEAIRLGAMAVPPLHGPFLEKKDGKICGACVIGTAAFAVLGHAVHDVSVVSFLEKTWPDEMGWTMFHRVPHPVTGDAHANVVSVAIELFEADGWTREQIADWVESVEQANESTPATARAVTA